MRQDNPWGQTGRISAYFASMKPRAYLDIFYPLVHRKSINRAQILMGRAAWARR